MIISKITQEDTNDCTNQQAFYKLREAIVVSFNIDKEAIKVDTSLATLFPKKDRRKQILKLGNTLGFKLKVLRPSEYITTTIVILTFLSFLMIVISLFLKLYIISGYALIGFIGCIILLKITSIFGSELDVLTVGALAEKMTREHYLESRKNPSTANKSEIVKHIEKLFIDKLRLDIKEIKPETLII